MIQQLMDFFSKAFLLAYLVLILVATLFLVSVTRETDSETTINDKTAVEFSAGPSEIRQTDIITHYVYLPFIRVAGPTAKKGVAAPFNTPSCTDANTLKTSWYYNWTVTADSGCPADERFVPRIWGKNDVTTANLNTAIANAQQSGWIIGFNEPNLNGASYISPAQGAELWRQIEIAVEGTGIKLVSPAPNPYSPSHPDTDYGYTWLREMVKEYQQDNGGNLPKFDAIGWHIYYHDPNVLKNYLQARHNDFKYDYPNAKIWVLEYNGCFTSNDPVRVMNELTPWMEQQDWIARYAWYNSRPDANPQSNTVCTLIDGSGNLKSLGLLYQSMSLK